MQATVLLFDVDGTLITTGGAGRRAIHHALEAAGVPVGESFSFAGMTDRAIVRQHIEQPGGEASEQHIDEVLAGYIAHLEDEVQKASATDYHLHDGMLEALDRAQSQGGMAVGLGTGNIERGARIKLRRVGIADRFEFGGFGCDSEDRAELLLAGAERGATRVGLPRTQCRVVVIGDTPRDIAAAKAIGAYSLAVATGRYGLQELAAHGPTFAFGSLAAAGAIDALLG